MVNQRVYKPAKPRSLVTLDTTIGPITPSPSLTRCSTMASKKTAPTDEELLAQFEGLNEEESPANKAKSASSKAPRPSAQQQSEADLLAELDNLAHERPASRPHTPRLQSSSTTSTTKSSPKRVLAQSNSASRISEEKAPLRKSAESSRSYHISLTPGTDNEAGGEGPPEPEKQATTAQKTVPASSSGGSWWGGILSTATAAVKQAEALAKEFQQNEEAQRWAEQVKGNVGALRGLGREIFGHGLVLD